MDGRIVRRGPARLRRAFTFAALALASACATATLPASESGPALGRPLPDFARPTIDGSMFSSASLRGRVVVVEFFAQYCKPCWKTLPQVERLAKSDSDLAVIGVGEDEFESETHSMAQKLGLSFPVLHDAGNTLAGRFRVGTLPTTLVLDRTGVVRWQARPGDGIDELRRAVSAVRRAPSR